MDVKPESFTDKVRRARREQRKNWTPEDEHAWLQDHPEDTPLSDVPPAEPETAAQGQFGNSHQTPEYDDLVPEIDHYEQSEEDSTVDAVVDRIGIVEAYNKWAHKGHVDPGNKTEGIKVRCPDPSHADHNPSAWLNTDKDVWTCGGCGMEGGDKFDIAAWGLGFPVPGYKTGKKFPDLKRAMAVDMGYMVTTKSDHATKMPDPGAESSEPSAPTKETPSLSPESSAEANPEPSATVTTLHPEHGDAGNQAAHEHIEGALSIDWRTIARKDKFLSAWMEATTRDDLPEEYHFWNGLTALSLALGRDLFLHDKKPVYGNLFTVTIGNTGSGKSQSTAYLTRILRETMPYDANDPVNNGAKIVKNVASGEVLIDNFVELHEDTGVPLTVPVRGLVLFPELQTLAGKSQNDNSILKSTLIEFYDCDEEVTTKSRGHGTVEARDAYASCATTTQRRLLRNLVTRDDANSGFLNRWVFVFGIAKPQVAYHGAIIDLEEPAKHLRSVKRWASTKAGNGLVLEGDALDVYEEFFRNTIAPLTDDSSINENDANENDPLLSRIALLFKKLILLLSADRMESSPSADTVRDALSLWPYIQMTYKMVGVSIATNEMTELENSIMSYIDNFNAKKYKTPGPTRKQITNAKVYKYERRDIAQALKTLEICGQIAEVTLKAGDRGPSKTCFMSVN